MGVRDRGGDGVQMKKRPADSLPPSPLPNQFHLIHPSSTQKEWEERGEVRSSAGGENKRCWGGGGVADVSSLTHQAEVCSLAHYKTLIKRGRGRRGGQGWGASSETGFGRRRGKRGKSEEKQKPYGRVTVWAAGGGRRFSGLGGWRVVPCKRNPHPSTPRAHALPSLPPSPHFL